MNASGKTRLRISFFLLGSALAALVVCFASAALIEVWQARQTDAAPRRRQFGESPSDPSPADGEIPIRFPRVGSACVEAQEAP